MALGNKVSDGEGILGGGARGKALIGHVEEREDFLLLHDVGNFGPLFLGRINTSGVVGTSVEQDDGLLWSCLQSQNKGWDQIIKKGTIP